MSDKVIYADDHLKLYIQQNDVYLETYIKGFPIDKFKSIFSSHPELEISNFIAIKSALTNAPRSSEKIGSLKERISLEIQNDNIKAHIKFNIPTEDLDESNREILIREALSKLNENGIVFGIKKGLFSEELVSGKSYVIAEGLPPVNGTDSIIKMYELQESKPEIDKDGNVDFYDLKLINRVQKGDWLGERIEATDGVEGKSIRGTVINPIKGKNFPFSYDKNTVQEIVENNKSVLYAKVSGAVNYYDGRIGVSNHLEIDGDVDFRTGNIKFDGYVTIKGTIADGFHVEATNDIEVNSSLGLGHIKGITSTKGSIFIKGGIASKGSSLIKAAKHVFTKFVDNTVIECGGTVHIGFYCINSNVSATEVILDSSNGKIIGGTISADIKVLSPVIGSEIEKKTIIIVKGFSRDKYKEYLDQSLQQITELKNEQQKSKQIMTSLESHGQLDPFKQKEHSEAYEKIIMIKQRIKDIDENRRDILGYLKAKGDGEVCVTKKIYPNCTLIIKGNKIEITAAQLASAYYLQDGEIKQA
ncbi:MAG TPA: FapA family protein [Clostridia bacterium]|nr:FapA family protein [Clostridia bacterium]